MPTQLTLDFNHDISLLNHAKQLVALQLHKPVKDVTFESEEEQRSLLSQINLYLCGSSPKMLKELVQVFYPFISHKIWAEHHFDKYIDSVHVFDSDLISLYDRYSDAIQADKWQKKLLRLLGVQLFKKNYPSHSWDDSARLYSKTSAYLAADSTKQSLTKEFIHTQVRQHIVEKFDTLHFDSRVKFLKFLLDVRKDDATANLILSIEEFKGFLLKHIEAIDAYYLKTLKEETAKSSFSTHNQPIIFSEYPELRDAIFTDKFLSTSEKDHILHDILKLPINHFYSDPSHVKNIINSGSSEQLQNMLVKIQYPVVSSKTYQSHRISGVHDLVCSLTGITRIQVGRGIRIAAWFLQMCENDFLKGKTFFEYCFEHIKHEFSTTDKIAKKEGIDFLIAYCQHKGKTSVTIERQVAAVKTAFINYEHQKLQHELVAAVSDKNQLCLDLQTNDSVAAVKPKAFKL